MKPPMYSIEREELSERIIKRLGEFPSYSLYGKQTKVDFIELFVMLAIEQERLDQHDYNRLMLFDYLDKVKGYPENMIWIKQGYRKVGIMKQNLSKYLEIPTGAFKNLEWRRNLIDIDVVIKKFGLTQEQLDVMDTNKNKTTYFWRFGTSKYPFYCVEHIIHYFPKIIGNWAKKEKEFNDFIPIKDREGDKSYVNTNAWKNNLKLAYLEWSNKHKGIEYSYETNPFSKKATFYNGGDCEIENSIEVNRIKS